MVKKISGKAALAILTAAFLAAGVINASPDSSDTGKATAVDYASMSPEALAEHLVLKSNSFKTDQPVQEGGVAGKRLEQDELQRLCSALRDKPIDSDTAARVVTMARESIKYPAGGIKLGDWRIGRELAWSGFGYRIGHRVDDHATAANGPGGNCYNCHQMATDRTGGNIGPSLTAYGKLRGNSEAMLKYTYDLIYNPHAYFACTNMPRLGANGVLSEEQISHIMAYLFDPESPVNQ
ncbi:MAG: sulfur oxidation c-type cytochrome SoxX [Sedimenticolaceae bacterium]